MRGVLGQESKFTVETTGAGEGEMEIAVSADGHLVPNTARPLGSGKYEVSFVGSQPVVHVVTVTYNGQHVEGSPFFLNFVDASHMTATVRELIPRDHGNQFTIVAPAANLQQELAVKIKGPQGSRVPAQLGDCGDGSYTVDWLPKAVGVYTVQVEYSGVAIRGSPFSVQVYDAALVLVSGIRQGLVGVPVTFYLDANNAGDGDLEIQVMAAGESVANQARQEKDAKFSVTFTPRTPTRHKISVTFNGDPVPGSPFSCQVVDTATMAISGEGLTAAPANTAASFSFHPQGARDFEFRSRVVSPLGHDVPVRITGDPHTGYKVDYIPVDIGRHQVWVEYGGRPVRGSPFSVPVFDPALVRVNSAGRAYLTKPFTLYRN
ncbi:filamin-B-like [Babylonia areolata]|uniref:filamin-B-like n=1 Tax=Babylonia areolata TaxID=304850 RepID=UPI003FD320CA